MILGHGFSALLFLAGLLGSLPVVFSLTGEELPYVLQKHSRVLNALQFLSFHPIISVVGLFISFVCLFLSVVDRGKGGAGQ